MQALRQLERGISVPCSKRYMDSSRTEFLQFTQTDPNRISTRLPHRAHLTLATGPGKSHDSAEDKACQLSIYAEAVVIVKAPSPTITLALLLHRRSALQASTAVQASSEGIMNNE